MGEMMIDGVSLHPLRQISVPNGDLWHALKATDDGFAGFGEAYFTQIEPHKIKGWKLSYGKSVLFGDYFDEK